VRLILPLLSTADPEALLDGLRGTVPIPAAEADGGRTASLAASITYSLRHLTPAVHRLLPAACLFQRVADAGLLASMSQAEGAPVRFRATEEQWRAALDVAADVGLVTRLGNGRYQVHAALPAYLAAAWRRHDPDGFAVMHDAATRALLTACALLGDQLIRQTFGSEGGPALEATTIHQRTFGQLLGYALDHQLWPEALAVAQPLHRLWEVGGQEEQAAAWGERVLRALADHGGPDQPSASPAGALWLLFTWSAANRLLTRHQLDDAERAYQQLMTVLRAQPRSHLQRQHLAGGYHQLGMIAQERGRLGEARDNYLKAVTIRREIGEKRQLAETYVHLGTVEEHSGNLRAARAWYGRALPIQHEARALPDLAVTYHQLGILDHHRGKLTEAERWYLLGLRIRRDLGDRPGMATAYQQLGALALTSGNLHSAETWYSRALAIDHELGHTAAVATSYHQLGVIAHQGSRLDDAERWYALSYRGATEVSELAGAAPTASQLGMVAEERGDLRAALEWTIRCVAAFDQFPHPQTEYAQDRLVRLTAQLGVPVLESCWQGVTGAALPPGVREFARSARPPGSNHASGEPHGGPS
jgi:tetratricopeptide (TPR) repeat protein